jgi:hypothetical protein
MLSAPAPDVPTVTLTRPTDTVNGGNLPAIVHSAMQQDLAVEPANRAAIVNRVRNIRTRADAAQYMAEVQQKVRPVKTARAGGN